MSKTPGKILVVGCDGTWDNSDAGTERSLTGTTLQIPSNVTRFVRCLAPLSSSGKLQVGYYQRGIGTDGDLENYLIGGLTGNDITEKIREAYGFICNNFSVQKFPEEDQEDEIVLLGFSRGAFTARAISSLISDVGLLTKLGMEYFYGIIEDWKNQDVPGKEWKWYQSKFGNIDPESFGWAAYRNKLVDVHLTRIDIKIRAVGVFDTVGALGIPLRWTDKVQEFSFVNTKVARCVEYAFHALALDEHRALFGPTVWEQPTVPHDLKELKQCWFPGVHANCGGGYPDAGMSNITLAWMMSQMEKHDILKFDDNYGNVLLELQAEYANKGRDAQRLWGMGRIYDSTSGFLGTLENSAKPPKARTPGFYHQVNSKTGEQTSTPLVNTGECIHRSVRIRVQNNGSGTEDDPKPTTMLGTLSKAITKQLGKLVGSKAKKSGLYMLQVFTGAFAPLKYYELTQSDTIYGGVRPANADAADYTGKSGYFYKSKDTAPMKRILEEDDLLPTEEKFIWKVQKIAQRGSSA